MAPNAPAIARVKRLRERRSRGVALVAPVEVGEGGLGLPGVDPDLRNATA